MFHALLALALVSAVAPFEARTLDGRTLKGSLVELSADHATIASADGRASLDTKQLLAISRNRNETPNRHATGLVVELMDGSVIRADQYLVHGGNARITLEGGDVLETPTSAVRTVQFQASAEASAEWSRLLGRRADSDLLVVRAEGSLDAHQGILHDVADDTVRFDLDGEVLAIRRSKVYGLAYRHSSAAELPPAVCRITDTTGSQWAARSLTLNGKLQWVTAAGLSVSQPLERIAEIDFSDGKLTYLSDMKPESTVWTPFFAVGKPLPAMEQFYAPRFDRGFRAGGLELGGVPYAKGLAVHAHTKLVYHLPSGFRRFMATVGMDDAARPNGAVRLVIRGDDRPLWDGQVSGNEAPKTIDVDVAASRHLTVEVDFIGSLTAGSRLLLCNARVVK